MSDVGIDFMLYRHYTDCILNAMNIFTAIVDAVSEMLPVGNDDWKRVHARLVSEGKTARTEDGVKAAFMHLSKMPKPTGKATRLEMITKAKEAATKIEGRVCQGELGGLEVPSIPSASRSIPVKHVAARPVSPSVDTAGDILSKSRSSIHEHKHHA